MQAPYVVVSGIRSDYNVKLDKQRGARKFLKSWCGKGGNVCSTYIKIYIQVKSIFLKKSKQQNEENTCL